MYGSKSPAIAHPGLLWHILANATSIRSVLHGLPLRDGRCGDASFTERGELSEVLRRLMILRLLYKLNSPLTT